MQNKIAIFYHIFQKNHWKDVFVRQILSLQRSGLYDAADYIHFGVNGNEPLPYELSKINSIKLNSCWNSEEDTLADLHAFAKEHEEYTILYIHTKGVTATPELDCWENINLWFDYLEYFNVEQWRACVDQLDIYDCVGTDWIADAKFPHYSGNFWWANADYIAKLETNFLHHKCVLCGDDSRFRSQYWIGTKSPAAYSFHSSNKNKYSESILPEEYKNIEIKINQNNLQFIMPSLHNKFWSMFGSSLNNVYGKREESDAIVSLAIHNHVSLENIKEQYKDHKLIAYQAEPLVENHWFKAENIINNIKHADEIWDYDLENVNLMKSHGINAKFKPPLYTRSLKRVKNSENPDIDLLFYGSYTEHRLQLLSNFLNSAILVDDNYDLMLNHNLVTIWNVHDKELDEYIGRSKIILNMNPYSGNCRQQQTRIFYNLINNKCVLSEKSAINYYGDMIVEFSGFQDLCDKFCSLIRNDNWKNYTRNNFSSHSRKFLREGEKIFEDQLRNLKQQ
jgi:hypothetical protein